MKRYKQILLYVVSTVSSIYNCRDRWHVKLIIKKLIVSVQNFWYDPRTFIKIGEYLTAPFIINAKVRSLIIQPLQI